VIVFWGDHGYHLGERGKWAKHGSLFEAGTRVPLIVAAPGSYARGRAVTRPVQTLDLYPTLCELCGLETPAGVEGHSLRTLLSDTSAPWAHPAYTVAGNRKNLGVAVRTEKYRYAEWNGGQGGAMLFDESSDPDELKNLVDDPALAKVRDELSLLARKHVATLR
jgi:arylsulfatase A-like enzyme